jgi:hypothetical protein
VHVGVSGGDRVRDRLQYRGLARLRRGDDEAALALADGGDQVDDARRGGGVAVFEAEPLVRVDGREVIEAATRLRLIRRPSVDGGDAGEGRTTAARGGDRALDLITLAQSVLADLAWRRRCRISR